jgi:ankyrin repeat protein
MQLDIIKNCSRATDVRRELKLLPKTVDETYERILLDIKEPRREAAKRTLQWLAFSKRTLRIEELAVAVAIKPGVSATNRCFRDIATFVKSLSSMVSVVNREITTDDHDYAGAKYGQKVDDVKLAHYSVQEFLTSGRIQESPASRFAVDAGSSHAVIAEACIRYLLMFDAEDSLEKTTLVKERLLGYAARNWHFHVRQAAGESQVYLGELAVQLFTGSDWVNWPLRNWIRVFDPDGWMNGRDRIHPVPKELPQRGIYYASKLGLVKTARQLLTQMTCQVNDPWAKTRCALPSAAGGGYDDIVKMLLDAGADLRNQLPNGLNALHEAVAKGHISTIKLLLQRGARVEAKDRGGETALHLAAATGVVEVCELLISHGASVSERDNAGWTPLHKACESLGGRETVILSLIRHGATPTAVNNSNNSPLHYACSSQGEVVINLLLSKGAVLDALNHEGASPLNCAVHALNHEAVVALLQHGPRILYNATSEEDDEGPIDSLLKLSGSIDPSDYYDTYYDCETEEADLVTLALLEHGFGRDSDYGALLLLAASHGWDRTVEYILTKTDTDPLFSDAKGDSALHIIIRLVAEDGGLGCFEFTCAWIKRLERIILLLLQKGGPKSGRALNKAGESPLKMAMTLGWEIALALLIRHRVPYHRTPPPGSERGRTWGHLAINWSIHGDDVRVYELIRALAARGERFDGRDDGGKAPVHHAFCADSPPPTTELLETLIDVGVDMTARTVPKAETVLHLYAETGSIWDDRFLDNAVEVVRLVVGQGVDLMATDSAGRTAIERSQEQFRPGCDHSRKILEALETVAKEFGLEVG